MSDKQEFGPIERPPVPESPNRSYMASDPRSAQRGVGRLGNRSGFRRSRKVLIIKFALPLIAVGLVGLVLTWPQLQSGDEDFRLDATTNAGDARNAKPQVLNPRLSGIDKDGQPFEITADIGTQTVGDNGAEIYYLTRPKADMALSGGSWVALSANDGVYEVAAEVLVLRGGVSLFHDSGVEFQTDEARIMMGERAALSDVPVFGFGEFGEIEAEGFRILDHGDRIVFTGPARLLLANEGANPFVFATTVDEVVADRAPDEASIEAGPRGTNQGE